MGNLFGKKDHVLTKTTYYRRQDKYGYTLEGTVNKGDKDIEFTLYKRDEYNYFYYSGMTKMLSQYLIYDDVKFNDSINKQYRIIPHHFTYKKLICDTRTNDWLILDDDFNPLYLVEYGNGYSSSISFKPTLKDIEDFDMTQIYLALKNVPKIENILPKYDDITKV